jgi:hypothetical protein
MKKLEEYIKKDPWHEKLIRHVLDNKWANTREEAEIIVKEYYSSEEHSNISKMIDEMSQRLFND